MFPLRLIEPPIWLEEPVAQPGSRYPTHRLFQPGDCWYAIPKNGQWYFYPEDAAHEAREIQIAPEHAGKHPMIVVFPGEQPWCIHSPFLTKEGWGSSGWQVSGELPKITVSPSLNFQSQYRPNAFHGHVIGGVVKNA